MVLGLVPLIFVFPRDVAFHRIQGNTVRFQLYHGLNQEVTDFSRNFDIFLKALPTEMKREASV
jgi:hypothetical protein